MGTAFHVQTRWFLGNLEGHDSHELQFGLPFIQTDSLGKIDFLMNFSKHSNLRLSKTTESFQTNFNLCLVSFDCAIKGRLGRGREPTTSPRERRSGDRRNVLTVVPYTSSPKCGSKRLDGTTRWLLFPNSWPHRVVSFLPLRQPGHFYWTLLWTMTSSFSLCVSFLSALLCLKKLETNKFLVFFQGEGDFEILFFCWM